MYAVAAATAASAVATYAASITSARGSSSEGVADWGAEDCSGSFLECLEDIWERDTTTGFIEFSFDPQSQVLRETCLARKEPSCVLLKRGGTDLLEGQSDLSQRACTRRHARASNWASLVAHA